MKKVTKLLITILGLGFISCDIAFAVTAGSYTAIKRVDPTRPNQDRSLIVIDKDNDIDCFGIFDGHGTDGHRSADIAKHQFSHDFRLFSTLETRQTEQNYYEDICKEIDKTLSERDDDGCLVNGGTTATVVVRKKNFTSIAHIGDSQCLVCDKDGNRTYLTSTHNIGTDAEERGRVINDTHLPTGGLTRTLGDYYEERNGQIKRSDKLLSIPNYKRIPTNTIRFVVLASDGLWNYYPGGANAVQKYVFESLAKGETPSTIAQALVEGCPHPNEDVFRWDDDLDDSVLVGNYPTYGDDTTVIVVDFENQEDALKQESFNSMLTSKLIQNAQLMLGALTEEELKQFTSIIRELVGNQGNLKNTEIDINTLAATDLIQYLNRKNALQICEKLSKIRPTDDSATTNPVNVIREERLDNNCAICLESLKEGAILIETNCHHLYHSDCLQAWRTHGVNHTACPNCNQKIQSTKSVERSSDIQARQLKQAQAGRYSRNKGAMRRRLIVLAGSNNDHDIEATLQLYFQANNIAFASKDTVQGNYTLFLINLLNEKQLAQFIEQNSPDPAERRFYRSAFNDAQPEARAAQPVMPAVIYHTVYFNVARIQFRINYPENATILEIKELIAQHLRNAHNFVIPNDQVRDILIILGGIIARDTEIFETYEPRSFGHMNAILSTNITTNNTNAYNRINQR